MKKANFDTLLNLPVPESWIEKALAIPETAEQKPVAVPFWRRSRFIAAAASIVLVGALSILLYQVLDSKPPVVAEPSATEIVWSTDESGETVATEVVIIHGGHTPEGVSQTGTNAGTDATAPTGHPASEGASPADSSPTAKPAPGGTDKTNPTEKTSPTESGQTYPTEPMIADFTEPGVQPTGEPQHGTTSPTEQPWDPQPPTASPWFPPTEAPWFPPTEADDPEYPTQPNVVPRPTVSPYQAAITNAFSKFSNKYIAGKTVYCRVYGQDGTEYGDSDRYSAQHIANLTYSNGYYTASYTPRDYGVLPSDGVYRYEFYTDSRVLSTGTASLSAS